MTGTRAFFALSALAAAALTVGCGSACQDLAERICACNEKMVGAPTKDSCVSQVKNTFGITHPSDSDQKFCQSKLSTCPDPADDGGMCERLKTEPGKVACGLAY